MAISTAKADPEKVSGLERNLVRALFDCLDLRCPWGGGCSVVPSGIGFSYFVFLPLKRRAIVSRPALRDCRKVVVTICSSGHYLGKGRHVDLLQRTLLIRGQ